jgi:hypothetical protein
MFCDPFAALRGSVKHSAAWSSLWSQVQVDDEYAGRDPFSAHVDPFGRSEVRDHEAGAGVDDDRVVAADVGVVENDVVLGPLRRYPGGALIRAVRESIPMLPNSLRRFDT